MLLLLLRIHYYFIVSYCLRFEYYINAHTYTHHKQQKFISTSVKNGCDTTKKKIVVITQLGTER